MGERTPKVRVLLVDDHTLVRTGLRMLIESDKGLEVVGEAGNKHEALAAAAACSPDVIVLDIDLGRERATDFLADLLRSREGVRALVLTGLRDTALHRECIRLGARGVLLKDQAPGSLLKALHKVHDGELWLDRSLTAELIDVLTQNRPAPHDPEKQKLATLTTRELEVIGLVAEGCRNREQVVNVNVTPPAPTAQRGNWKFTYTYDITPTQMADPQTAWTSQTTGGTVDLGFSGFVASESFQKQSSRTKYSFSVVDDGLTRARDVSATLMKDVTALASLDLDNVDTDLDTVNDGLAVVPAAADFSYFGNGGIFGNSAVFPALHAVGRKPANGVVNILNGIADGSLADNFAGNNNDLAAGNVHVGPYAGSFDGLTEPGTYTVVVAGTLKGNSSSADFGFSVTSNLIQIGGCAVP